MVDGRSLHKALKGWKSYEDWIMKIEKFEFEINIDYTVTRRRVFLERALYEFHVFTLDAAKRIVANDWTKGGTVMRRYLIKAYRELMGGKI